MDTIDIVDKKNLKFVHCVDALSHDKPHTQEIYQLLISWFRVRIPGRSSFYFTGSPCDLCRRDLRCAPRIPGRSFFLIGSGFSLWPMPQEWPMLAGGLLGQPLRLAPASHETGVGNADLRSACPMSQGSPLRSDPLRGPPLRYGNPSWSVTANTAWYAVFFLLRPGNEDNEPERINAN